MGLLLVVYCFGLCSIVVCVLLRLQFPVVVCSVLGVYDLLVSCVAWRWFCLCVFCFASGGCRRLCLQLYGCAGLVFVVIRFVVLGGFGLNSGVCIVVCGCLCVWCSLVRLGLLV